jgi:hypothetical protein
MPKNKVDYHNQHDDADKPRLAKVLRQFPRALRAVAQVGMYGAKKYTWDGWMETPDLIERYEDSMIRHAFPEDGLYCNESNFLHRAHLVWNALATLEQMIIEGVPSKCEPLPSIRKRLESILGKKLDHSTSQHVTTEDVSNHGDSELTHIHDTLRYPIGTDVVSYDTLPETD